MNGPTLEHAAKYLSLWLNKEEEIHKAVRKMPSEMNIRRAAAQFGVSRSIKGMGEPPVRKALVKLLGGLPRASKSAIAEQVEKLAAEMREHTGTFNVSAASKLLWMRWRGSYIIFDSRAKRALSKALGYSVGETYADYCAAWHKAYAAKRSDVAKACSRLPKVYKHCVLFKGVERAEVERICRQRWFMYRVFDNYLWQLGKPGAGASTGRPKRTPKPPAARTMAALRKAA